MSGSAGELGQQEDLGTSGTFRTALLHTRDVASAARFYEAVFGWELRDSTTASSFTLHGQRVAGIRLTTEEANLWVPYVAVDETKRSRWSGGSIKSLDFIVSPPGEVSWLVDVKGRRFPSGEQRQYWKNWSTRDDLVSLARWERLFGERFGGLFMFAYNVVGDRAPLPAESLFEFRGALYGFVGIRLREYAMHARPISSRCAPSTRTASTRSSAPSLKRRRKPCSTRWSQRRRRPAATGTTVPRWEIG